MSEKTEEPTPRRLQRALEEGDSGISTVAGQAVAFVVAIALAPRVFGALANEASRGIRSVLASVGEPVVPAVTTATNPGLLVDRVLLPVLGTVVPFLLAIGVVGGTIAALQAGGVIAVKRLAPNLERLDPIRGFQNLFQLTRVLSVVRALVAAFTVAALVAHELRTHAVDFVHLAGRTEHVANVAQIVAFAIAKWSAVVGLALAAFDLFTTRRQWRKRLRMSKDEVKREHKEQEGDPTIKAARERAHHEMLTAALAHDVKRATVVVVNPTHLACALRYDAESGDAAPVLVASGEGVVAQEIVRAARAYGVPVVRDISLARALIALEQGDEIPEALYEAVAAILTELLAEPG